MWWLRFVVHFNGTHNQCRDLGSSRLESLSVGIISDKFFLFGIGWSIPYDSFWNRAYLQFFEAFDSGKEPGEHSDIMFKAHDALVDSPTFDCEQKSL